MVEIQPVLLQTHLRVQPKHYRTMDAERARQVMLMWLRRMAKRAGLLLNTPSFKVWAFSDPTTKTNSVCASAWAVPESMPNTAIYPGELQFMMGHEESKT
ncbi:hypothetical protein LCGC14_2668420 [marine sediment metagenome]|uniref:Uncharacterized protein n=1 Tax=marine sediment metagenome TaxID=412755 RepID=A0A0F9ACA5_9ZZZZ